MGAGDGELGDDVALGVEVHVGAGCGGGLFAVVEEDRAAVLEGGVFSDAAGGCGADEHEAAATDVAGGGVDDGEGKANGYGGVDGVAALVEDFYAGVGGVVVDGDDHGVGGAGGGFGEVASWWRDGRLSEIGDG